MKENAYKDFVADCLEEAARNVREGKCGCSPEELAGALEVCKLCDPLESTETAANFMGVNPSTFRNMAKDGRVPEGKHRRGFKEKSWLRSELKLAILKIRQNCHII